MIEILSSREYGEEKLKKPKETSGAERVGSVNFGPKCKCPAYVKDGFVYIKHRDWFSKSISIDSAIKIVIINKKKNKFVYNDNFGSVVLRGEAWIKVRGHSPFLLTRELEEAVHAEPLSLECYEWNYFFEQVILLLQAHKYNYNLDEHFQQLYLRS